MIGVVFLFFFLCNLMKSEHLNETENIFNFPAYVINLPKNTDRLKMISGHLRKLQIPFVIVEATHGKDLRNANSSSNFNSTSSEIKKLDPEIKYDLSSKTLRDGVLGCWMSHLKVLLLIARKNSTEPILILEDDSEFIPTFISEVKEIFSSIKYEEWDFLRVGFCPENVSWVCENNHETPQNKFCKVRKGVVYAGAHAYFVNGSKGARKLFDNLNNVEGKIIDLEMRSEETNQYTSIKKLVYQDQSFESNSQNVPCV